MYYHTLTYQHSIIQHRYIFILIHIYNFHTRTFSVDISGLQELQQQSMWPLKPPILSTKLLQNRKKPNVIVQEMLRLIATFKIVNNVEKIRTVYFQKRIFNYERFISTKYMKILLNS